MLVLVTLQWLQSSKIMLRIVFAFEYWSIEKHQALAGLPEELDKQKFPPKRITIPEHLQSEFADSDEDSDSDDSDAEEEVQAAVDDTINVYDARNRHKRISSENEIGYEARKAELFALAMTYWFICKVYFEW